MIFRQYGRRAPGRARLPLAWWDCCASMAHLVLRVFFGFRIHGREHIPQTGGVLFVCNHQSYLDPLINGASLCDRPSRIFARGSLFKLLPFRLLIRSLGAIPISGEASDKETMRLGLEELAAGRTLLVYPEGSRTFDGAMQPFKPGIGVLLKRSRVVVVPVGIDGAFDAWPRKGPMRLFRKIETEIGTPISSEELLADGVRPALARLEREVDALRMQCRARIRERSGGRQPAPGPADEPFGLATGEEPNRDGG